MGTDFFEPPSQEPDRHVWQPPVWWQPPDDELAALVPDRRVLARSESSGVVVVLSHVDVFSTGCSFRVRVTLHRRDGLSDDEWFDLHEVVMGGPRRRPSSRGLPDDLLRFGVQFGDGAKATTTAAPMHPSPVEPPAGPVLLQHGGGGSGGDRLATSSHALWLWPLPPREPFDLVLEWPTMGVDLRRVTLDGDRIHQAADAVRPMWDDAG